MQPGEVSAVVTATLARWKFEFFVLPLANYLKELPVSGLAILIPTIKNRNQTQ